MLVSIRTRSNPFLKYLNNYKICKSTVLVKTRCINASRASFKGLASLGTIKLGEEDMFYFTVHDTMVHSGLLQFCGTAEIGLFIVNIDLFIIKITVLCYS